MIFRGCRLLSIKKPFITYIVASALIFTMISSIASAETSIIKTQELDGKKYVSLTDLTRSYGGTIENNPETKITTYTLNGKIIAINNKTAFVSIDGNLIPLETKELEGIKIPNFQPARPQSDNGEVLFPVSIVENYVGIKATDKGFNVNTIAVDKEASTTEENTTTQSEETYYYQEPYTESPSANESQVTPSTETPAAGSSSNNGSTTNSSTNNVSSSGNSQSPTEPAVPQTPVEPEIPKPEEPTTPEETTQTPPTEETTPTQPTEETTPSEQTETPQPTTGEPSAP